MVINTDKLIDVRNIKIDLTQSTPGLYFFFNIPKKIPRYSRVNGKYVIDSKGKFIFDQGFDIFDKTDRVLKYIGESGHCHIRWIQHYTFGHQVMPGKASEHKVKMEGLKGVGPCFTHIRLISGLKRMVYDTIRRHHETILVRKYLPQINKNSSNVLGDLQKMILLKSEGQVKLSDLVWPYELHARDIYKAAEAWKNEDWDWVRANCILKRKYRFLTIDKLKRMKQSIGPSFWFGGKKMGEKKKFSRWFRSAVLFNHKKQIEARRDFTRRIMEYKRIYTDPYFDKQLTLNL